VRAGDDFIRGPADLDGRRVGVRASSSFHGTLTRLREQVTGLRIVTMDEHLDMEILSRVAEGELDAAVADDDLVDQVLTWRRDLQPAFYLTGPRPVAWAMRPGNTELKAAVDRFLRDQALLGEPESVALGDLDRIRNRRVLRVLTRNNAATTFLHRGKQVGFEYELIRKFARSIGCRVQLVIPPGFEDLLPWLMEGRGDIVAASLVATPDRRRRAALTRPYLNATQLLVARTEDAPALRGPADLAGRRVAVRASSIYHRTLESLRDEGGIPLEIQVVPESTETEDLIAGVANGTYDATVAVSHIFAIARAWQPNVVGAFGLGKPLEIAWAIRPEDTKLMEAADAFLKIHGRGTTFLNVLRKKYFTDAARISRRVRNRPEVSGRISPYDGLFRQYGAETGLDWRLLAAQAYQESRFRPAARSWSGALGIMQVLPRTAREMGVEEDLLDPETSIRAGALYLKYLAETQYRDLPPPERLRFALGAYNAGPGHIRDGRKLARERGLDPDIWFGSVDGVLPDLSLRAVASKARYGYCRCRETVEYVGGIEERYKRYKQALN
jgi:membrane-bound lytic murein transglycosylase F